MVATKMEKNGRWNIYDNYNRGEKFKLNLKWLVDNFICACWAKNLEQGNSRGARQINVIIFGYLIRKWWRSIQQKMEGSMVNGLMLMNNGIRKILKLFRMANIKWFKDWLMDEDRCFKKCKQQSVLNYFEHVRGCEYYNEDGLLKKNTHYDKSMRYNFIIKIQKLELFKNICKDQQPQVIMDFYYLNNYQYQFHKITILLLDVILTNQLNLSQIQFFPNFSKKEF